MSLGDKKKCLFFSGLGIIEECNYTTENMKYLFVRSSETGKRWKVSLWRDFQACFAASANKCYFIDKVRILCLSCKYQKDKIVSEFYWKEQKPTSFQSILNGFFFLSRSRYTVIVYYHSLYMNQVPGQLYK